MAEHACSVSMYIEKVRLKNRQNFGDHVMLDTARYGSERMCLRTMCWLMECQCNLLAYLAGERTVDRRTGRQFAAELSNKYLHLMVYLDRSVIEYSMLNVRFAMLRLLNMWTQLPLLDPKFQEYIVTLRMRMSMLQALAFPRGSPELDYPAMTRTIPSAKGGTPTHCRASTKFAETMEMYYYYLHRQIVHEQEFDSRSVPLPKNLLRPDEVQHLRDWLQSRKDDVLLQQLRREVNSRALNTEVTPPERGIYTQDYPVGYTDNYTVLRYMRARTREQLDRVLTGTRDNVSSLVPMLSAFYHIMFLIQGDAGSFDLRDFFFFVDDFPSDTDGCSYPSVQFFVGQMYPTVYIPQTQKAFYIAIEGCLYKCPPDIFTVTAAWLKAAVGMWGLDVKVPTHKNSIIAERFEVLVSSLVQPNYNSPVMVANAVHADPAVLKKEEKLLRKARRIARKRELRAKRKKQREAAAQNLSPLDIRLLDFSTCLNLNSDDDDDDDEDDSSSSSDSSDEEDFMDLDLPQSQKFLVC